MAEEGKSMGRGLRVLLYGSLFLNLLIVGIVAGVILSGGPGKGRHVDRGDAQGFTLLRALPREDRAELRERFEAMRRGRGAFDAGKQPSKEDILAALRATPFDPEAFSELVADQSRTLAERGKLGQEALVAQITEMADDERLEYADRVEEAFSRRRSSREIRDRPRY